MLDTAARCVDKLSETIEEFVASAFLPRLPALSHEMVTRAG